MSGKLRSLTSKAILVIALLFVSPILTGDRTLAQDRGAVLKEGHGQSESLNKVVPEKEREKAQPPRAASFKEAAELAGNAFSRHDLERVVAKYQEFLKRSDADQGMGNTGRALLELGRFNLYLKRYDEADASLAQALKMCTAPEDETAKARILAIQVVLYMQKNDPAKAVELLEQALRLPGSAGDPRSRTMCLRYVAKIYEDCQHFDHRVDCSEKRGDQSQPVGEPGGEIKIMNRISRQLRAKGMHEMAERVGEQSLATARAMKDKKWEASALANLANVYKDRGQYDRAFVRYLKALKIYEQLGDATQQAWLMNSLGRVLVIEGNYQEAKDYHEKALKIARNAKDLKGEVVSLGGLGSVYLAQGQYAQAAECHEKSLEIVRKLGDAKVEAYTLDHLGNVHLAWGQYAKASDCFEKSLAIRRQIGHAKGEATSLNELGRVYQAWGQLGKALKYLEQSLDIQRKIGDVQGEAISLNKLGEVCQSWGQYDKALEYFEKSLEITRKIGDVKAEAASLNNLGRVYRSWGQYDKALKCFAQSLEITRGIGDVKGEAASLNNLGRIHQSWGQYDKARECYEKSLEITRKIGDAQGEVASLRSMGIVSAALKRHEDAAHYYEEVLRIEKKLGISTSLTSALLAQLYMDMGDLRRAEVFCTRIEKAHSRGKVAVVEIRLPWGKRDLREAFEKGGRGTALGKSVRFLHRTRYGHGRAG